MGNTTRIGWTQRTWNPWAGCRKISPGCKNCYMFTEQRRYGRDPQTVVRTKTWGQPARWQRIAEADNSYSLCFTCSWSDFFIDAADQWRAEAWAVIKNTPRVIYQILTKRPERITAQLPGDWGAGYPNVWLGVSAENQRQANVRLKCLQDVPAVLRFVSAEPLLEPIEFPSLARIGWVIVGGESGPGPRECPVDGVAAIVRQCQQSGVLCYVKQDSGSKPEMQGRIPDDVWRMKQIPQAF